MFLKSYHLYSSPFSIPFPSLNSHDPSSPTQPTLPHDHKTTLSFVSLGDIIYPILIFHSLIENFRVLSLLKMQIPVPKLGGSGWGRWGRTGWDPGITFTVSIPGFRCRQPHAIYTSPVCHYFLATDLRHREGLSSGSFRPGLVRCFRAKRPFFGFAPLSYRSVLDIDFIYVDFKVKVFQMLFSCIKFKELVFKNKNKNKTSGLLLFWSLNIYKHYCMWNKQCWSSSFLF